MSTSPVGPPPIPTPLLAQGQNTPTRGWAVWFQSLTAALQMVWGQITGVGTGAAAAVEANAAGAATAGPEQPQKVAAWLPVTIGTQTYYVPVMK